jgi:magnesium transporter
MPAPGTIKALILENDEVRESSDLGELAAAHAAQKPFWIELDERSDAIEAFLVDVLHLHPLTIEDIWADIGIPKLEDYREYLQVVTQGLREEDIAGNELPVSLAELDMVIGERFILTHAHDEKACAITPVIAELKRNGKALRKGPAWVAHAILDRLVDAYLPVVTRFEDRIDALEARVLEGKLRDQHMIMRQILIIRRSLQLLRRTTVSQRELFIRLTRGEFDEIPAEATPFFRDVYDHFVRVTELVDTYREATSGLLEAHFSIQSQQMNEIMKRLTLISTIMLPLTLIAGIYGMNFKKVFPEIEWTYGYFYALGLMATIAVAILIYFRRRKWM